MEFKKSKRIESLKDQIRKTQQHIMSAGAYFTSEQRLVIASEARDCLTLNSSSCSEASRDAERSLPVELKEAVNKIMNFQSKCTADWYKSTLVPEAAAYASVSRIQEGAALECIAVCSITAALTILQLGLNESTEFPSDCVADNGGPNPSLRTKSHAKKITKNTALGWASFVTKQDLKHGLQGLNNKAIDRAVETAAGDPVSIPNLPLFKSLSMCLSGSATGDMVFNPNLPFKSLSLCLSDYAHGFDLAASLYFPLNKKNMTNLARISPGGLNRVQVETVAGAYTEARSCDF